MRLQSGDKYKGMVDCGTRILKDEGPLAFYKGTSNPSPANAFRPLHKADSRALKTLAHCQCDH